MTAGQTAPWDDLEKALSAVPLAEELAVVPHDGASRPWVVVRPSTAVLDRRRIANVFETVRFELENPALAFPEEFRPSGFTIARAPLPRDPSGAVDRKILADALGPAPPRSWPAAPPAATPLPSGWTGWLGAVPSLSRCPMTREASLEFDAGLDSLDRLAFLIAVGDAAGREVTDDEQTRLRTLGDVVDFFGAPPARPAGPFRVARVVDPDHRTSSYVLRPRLSWPVAAALSFAVRRKYGRELSPQVIGVDRVDWGHRPLIVAQNHLSYLDSFMVGMALPRNVFPNTFFLGFSGYFSRGWGAVLARLMRIEPISADERALTAIRVATAGVRSGQILVICPEGERSWSGRLIPFRRGVAWIARATGARVVPFAQTGTYEAWPRGRGYKPHPVRLAFGTPLDPPTDAPDDDVVFLARLRTAIQGLLREIGDPRA